MNTLPVVFTFMFLLALISGAFIKDFSVTQGELKTISQLFRAEKNLHNQLEKTLLPKASTAPKDATSSKTGTQKTTYTPNTPNTPQDPSENRDSLDQINNPASKLNISSLLKEPTSNTFLYDVTVRLLDDLYRELDFFKNDKKLSSKILDALIKEASQNPVFEGFVDLYPADPKLREVFYYMLRGTKSYNETNKRGYPPLENYLNIDKTKKGALVFQQCTRTILNSFFGESCTLELLQKEYEKSDAAGTKQDLSEPEVTDLILEKKALCSASDLKKYVRFGHNTTAQNKSIVGMDDESSFYIKLP